MAPAIVKVPLELNPENPERDPVLFIVRILPEEEGVVKVPDPLNVPFIVIAPGTLGLLPNGNEQSAPTVFVRLLALLKVIKLKPTLLHT